MKLSSDVNTIFAYGDDTHKFHRAVYLYMISKKRTHYILLSKIKSSFIYTYKKYLSTSCVIIEKAIRDERHDRIGALSTTYKPSPLVISTSVRKLIDDHIKVESERNFNFNENTIRKFVSSMLLSYSIPELYENDNSLGEFREKYLLDAEKRAEEVLNKFLHFFSDFDCMNIESYANYMNWVNKIKKSKFDVFHNKQDYEDIIICAEFLCYNDEIGKLSFFTCDRECYRSVGVVAKEYEQRIGFVNLIELK